MSTKIPPIARFVIVGMSLIAPEFLVALPAHAVDRGQYADVPKMTRDWVAALEATGTKAICCALSDSQILGDQDWDYGKDTYKVYLVPPDGHIFNDGSTGKWFNVPPESVVNVFPLPRQVNHALVWVSWTYDPNGDVEGLTLRCFLASAGF